MRSEIIVIKYKYPIIFLLWTPHFLLRINDDPWPKIISPSSVNSHRISRTEGRIKLIHENFIEPPTKFVTLILKGHREKGIRPIPERILDGARNISQKGYGPRAADGREGWRGRREDW